MILHENRKKHEIIRADSRTISCSGSESPYTLHFLFNSVSCEKCPSIAPIPYFHPRNSLIVGTIFCVRFAETWQQCESSFLSKCCLEDSNIVTLLICPVEDGELTDQDLVVDQGTGILSWSAWGPCTKTCGDGTKQRTLSGYRLVIFQPFIHCNLHLLC